METPMKKSLLALIALTALAAACHEQRQEPPIDESGIRARDAAAHRDLNRETPPPPANQAQ
jgi:nitrous oxide reductase accessory protein NosL